MSSLAHSDAEFFRNQPKEDLAIPTSDTHVYCDRNDATSGVYWDGNDGQGHDFWACNLCGSTSHKVVSA